MNARTRQLLDELLQLAPEDRAIIAAELEASLDDATGTKRARVAAAVERVVSAHEEVLAELAK